MMMRGLIAGGMQGVYGADQDWLNVSHGRPGYQPNPHGFYAMDDASEFARPDFAEEYAGKLVKERRGRSQQFSYGAYLPGYRHGPCRRFAGHGQARSRKIP